MQKTLIQSRSAHAGAFGTQQPKRLTSARANVPRSARTSNVVFVPAGSNSTYTFSSNGSTSSFSQPTRNSRKQLSVLCQAAPVEKMTVAITGTGRI